MVGMVSRKKGRALERQYAEDPDRERTVRLSDGRQLAMAEFGAETDIPVVFFAGAASSRSMNAYGAAARGRGVRLITFDRPGLGDSTPDPRKTLVSVADDLSGALAVLGIDRPFALANSQGAPFALTAAGRGMFRRTALVSPADEVAHPALQPLLPADLASFVASVRDDPDAVRSRLSGFDADGMFSFVMSGSSSSDSAVFEEEGFRRLFRRSLEEALRSGGDGYAQDTLLATSPWSAARPPAGSLDIWFGGDDRSHSPDLGATLADRFAGERVVVEGVGGSLLWTHTDDILDRLIA